MSIRDFNKQFSYIMERELNQKLSEKFESESLSLPNKSAKQKAIQFKVDEAKAGWIKNRQFKRYEFFEKLMKLDVHNQISMEEKLERTNDVAQSKNWR